MKKNMAVQVIDRLFIVVYGTSDPTDDEWFDYLKLVEDHGIDRTMQLIYTDGGGPNAVQRRYLSDLLADRTVPVAVISNSASVRHMVTALSWFNSMIEAFPPSGLSDALAHLEIPQSRADLIDRTAEALRREIGGT